MSNSVLEYLMAKKLRDKCSETIHGRCKLYEHLADVINALSKKNYEYVITALFHDFGKINPVFQKRMYICKGEGENGDIPRELHDFFLGFPELKERGVRHEYLSLIYFAYFNKVYNLINDKVSLKKVCNSIAWHHRNDLTDPASRATVVYSEDLVNHEVVKHFIVNLSNQLNIESRMVDPEAFMGKIFNWINKNQRVFLDLIAKVLDDTNVSGEIIAKFNSKRDISFDDFLKEVWRVFNIVGYMPSPLFIDAKDDTFKVKDDKLNLLIFAGGLKRADYLASAFEEFRLSPPREEVRVDGLSSSERPSLDNLWQEKVINEVFEEVKEKEVFVLEAPTGSGKTYFAYYFADKLLKDKKIDKVLYVLPYKAALNQKFERLSNNNINVGLIHSTSFLEFESVGGNKEFNNNTIEQKIAMSNYFYYPILLSTADQTLLTSIEFYPFDMYLNLYNRSLIIFDEPQAFSNEQLAILFRSIEYAVKSGAKVLIMTATLPSVVKSFIESKFKNYIFEIQDKRDVKNYLIKRHRVKCIFNKKDKKGVFKDILNKLKEKKYDKVLVILNKVDSAIHLYEEMKEKKVGPAIYLLHSRIGWERRQQILDEIKDKDNWVLITTQVVEAAIDLDADILFTVLSPIPSQIQRWGRVYRNRKRDYDSKEANIIIYCPNKEDLNKDGVYKDLIKNIYDLKVIKHSLGILKELSENVVLNYESEKQLITKFYSVLEENDVERVIEIYNDIPFFAVEISSKKEAHNLFRPEDYTVNVVIKEDVKKDGWGSYVELYRSLIKKTYSIPKYLLEKMKKEKKIEDTVIQFKIGGELKVLGQIGDIYFVSIPDYNNKKRDIVEKGLESL